jgi:hypothetical protein
VLEGNPAAVDSSYSAGPVTGTTNVGGLVGRVDGGSGADNFWDSQASQQSVSPLGTGRSTAEMKSLTTFASGFRIVAGWEPFAPSADPDRVWGICAELNDGYPFLLWEFAEEQVPSGCFREDGDDDDASTGNGGNDGNGETHETDETGGNGETGGGGDVSGDGASGKGVVTASTPVLSAGTTPVLVPGAGVWQRTDGSTVPLAVSSPGTNQVRYAADGVTVTFTGGAGTNVANGLVVNPAGEIVCEVCLDLAAGNVIEVWMFSTPRLVAAHLTQDLPCQTFSIPVVAPLDGGGPVSAGQHTLQLALPTASGMQAVNVGVTVGGPVPASVPAGEGPAVPAGLFVLGLLAAAGGVVAARRQVVTG